MLYFAGDALAAVFAPLLLPAPLAQDCPEPAAALVDTLIGHYRAVFSGADHMHALWVLIRMPQVAKSSGGSQCIPAYCEVS